MRVFYLSPSVLPSRSANSIHVIRMCEAFAALDCDVTLYAHRSIPEGGDVLRVALERYYGAKLDGVRLIAPRLRFHRALTLRLAIRSLLDTILRSSGAADTVVSRNLYAAYLLKPFLAGRLLFETHQLEFGFRKRMQASLMCSKRVTTVVISDALRRILADYHNMPAFRPIVLHDAAPDGINRFTQEEKRIARAELVPGVAWRNYKAMAGYFGHLYPGRGIEIIEALAERHPEVVFLIFGGNDTQIESLRQNTNIDNLRVMGFLEPSRVARAMGMMDILLMPYQRQVSIGVNRHDTARWMSPMKMFEYMAAGVPIVSSQLPVLAEVLKDGENCLMAQPEDVTHWSSCLQRLIDDPEMAEQLACNAHQDYRMRYSWSARARLMLELESQKQAVAL